MNSNSSTANTTTLTSNSWLRFWFLPRDPTTLGLMRIVAGLLVLYSHLAYCYDLREFFGPQGWMSLEAVNEDRRETPWYAPPLKTWEDFRPMIDLPDLQHRRAAILSFLKQLPNSPTDRDGQMRFLYNQDLPGNPIHLTQVFDFVQGLPEDAVEREETVRRALMGPEDAAPLLPLPDLWRQYSRQDREIVSLELFHFFKLLPANREDRRYVLEWLEDMPIPNRPHLRQYIQNLPEDRSERNKCIDYLAKHGIDPRETYAQGRPIWSIWFHITSPTGMWITHGAILGIIALFTVGLWTRVTGVLVWLAAMSYIHRTQQVLFGMDTMMNILLIYLMLSPCGAALSLDRLFERRRIVRDSFRRSGRIDTLAEQGLAGPRVTMWAGVMLRLFQLHFCMIYLSAGLSKLKGTTWWNHTASWYTLANPEFSPTNVGAYHDFLIFLSEYRWLAALVCSFGVIYTLVVEIGLPFLVWTRWRPYAVIGGVLLHAGIAMSMGLSIFSLMMMTMLLAFIPAQAIREMLVDTSKLVRLRLRFHAQDSRQIREVAWIRALDVYHQIDLTEEASEQVQVTTARPRAAKSQPLFDELVQSLGLLRPFRWLLWLPGVALLGRCWLPGEAEYDGPPEEPPASRPMGRGRRPEVAKKG